MNCIGLTCSVSGCIESGFSFATENLLMPLLPGSVRLPILSWLFPRRAVDEQVMDIATIGIIDLTFLRDSKTGSMSM